ncbi:MAG: bifunctional folylpolyglutamate synthase/dihydrofolate synthase [Lachnospiraceae bacterium]|nr:bifunctional folylpolyglutamate synthase/dihydrofolate synthase [Lachnospiraceae bacterium]
MEYSEARAFIEEKQRYGQEMRLDAIRALLAECGHPDEALKFIHIAGTNGKGSLLAYISTTLTCAGYRTGRYISPTLYSYRERIQIDGEPISAADFTRLTEVLYQAVSVMKQRGIPKPSPFELETVLGLLYFRQRQCDFVVLECGMGGRDDATNVIDPSRKCLAVLTSVSLDHTEYLGNTLTEIAAVKAAIAAEQVPLVMAPQKEETVRSVQRYCKEHHNPLITASLSEVSGHTDTLTQQSFWYKGEQVILHLAGAAQVENAITAWEALHYLSEHGVSLSGEQILEGLAKTSWNGRFTVLENHPVFVVDGAHNPDAAEKLKASAAHYFKGKKIVFIMGVLADKDYTGVLKLMLPLASEVFTITPPDNPRALSAVELAKTVEKYEKTAFPCASLKQAVISAVKSAGEDGVVLAFGSLSFIGPLTQILKEKGGAAADKENTDA